MDKVLVLVVNVFCVCMGIKRTDDEKHGLSVARSPMYPKKKFFSSH